MDKCHLKNAESEPEFQKYNGRAVLLGVIVTDDSGADAVFTEQGSSASQMTVKVNGCDCRTCRLRWASSGRTISLHPGQNGRCTLLKIPKSERPDIRIRLPRHKWPKSWTNIEDPVVPLERISDTHSLVSCGKDSSRKFCWNLDGKKVPN